jgi:DNA-binding transcriptional ArsR family regulator
MELVRQILLQIEAKGEHPLGWLDLDILGYDAEVVSHHVLLLQDAGMLEAQDLSSSAGFDVRPKRLTWNGHEFLDAARNDTIWKKATEIVKEKGGAIPFEVLRVLLTKLVSGVFGVG